MLHFQLLFLQLFTYILCNKSTPESNITDNLIVNETKDNLFNDFCNNYDTKIVNSFFDEVLNFFDINNNQTINEYNKNNTCFLLSPTFKTYNELFNIIENINKVGYSFFKCPICNKSFRMVSFLFLHFKLFHLKKEDMDNLICPGDFCTSINCKRYSEYFEAKSKIPIRENQKYNRQPILKEDNCNENLSQFYKETCMNLIKNCLKNEDDYFIYYKNICEELSCSRNIINEDITKTSDFSEVLKYILMYMATIFTFIYIVTIWLSKFT